MNWKRIAYVLYPILIGFLLPVLFYLATRPNQAAVAGIIRRAELSSDRPLLIRLAMGRSTAISFAVRPEKVVSGNPQGVEINFIGRDLTLRPLGSKPGNLIIYTKSSRYVILLQVGPESNYDDAVTISAFGGHARPIRLSEDTFLLEEVKLRDTSSKEETSIYALIRKGGRVIESDSFPSVLRCKGCVLTHEQSRSQLVCGQAVHTLDCRSGGRSIRLSRTGMGG